MEWGFWSNPVASLNGENFLLLFYTLIILSKYMLSKYESTLINVVPTIHKANANEDPLFIAWLKDPNFGIFKMVMAGLIEGEYVNKAFGPDYYKTTENEKPSPSELEKETLDFFITAKSLRDASTLFSELKSEYKTKAESECLILSKDDKDKILKKMRTAFIALFILGVYKMIAAIHNDHNNIILLLITLFLVIPVLFNESRFYRPLMYTAYGKECLTYYQEILSKIGDKSPQQQLLHNVLIGGAIITGIDAATNSDSGFSCGGSSCSGSSCGGSGCSGGSGCGGCGSR